MLVSFKEWLVAAGVVLAASAGGFIWLIRSVIIDFERCASNVDDKTNKERM